MGASFIAAFLIKLNDLPVDKAILYDFDPKSNWCVFFDRYLEPQKSWFAFKAYGEMLADSSFRAFAETDEGFILASCGEKYNSVLYSNFRRKYGKTEFVFKGLNDRKKLKVYAIDADKKYDCIAETVIKEDKIEIDVSVNSVLFFRFE